MGDSKFKNGNIVRVSIKNFLTFDNVNIYPKPYLNLILGPNGTGKSTILCAICICLGGKPEVTGRSKNIESYIKNGKDHATLEVELYSENGTNPVIRREFGKGGSKWQLQGKQVGKKEVDAVVKKFNIHIDNLCTFLPQDRVANFARMNNVQLLEATEKAVGDPKLFEYHEELRDGGERIKSVLNKVSNMTKEMETLQRQNANMKDLVENVQEKERIEKDIRKYEIYKIYHTYEKKRVNVKKSVEKLNQLSEKLRECKRLIEPMHKRIEEAKGTFAKEKRGLHDKFIKFQEANQKCSHHRRQVDKLIEDAKAAGFEFRTKKDAARQRMMDLENFRKQLDAFESQYQSLPAVNEKELELKKKRLTQEITAATSRQSQVANELDDYSNEKRVNMNIIRNSKIEIDKAKDVLKQRMELLKKVNADSYKAAVWLESNGHLFSSPVYNPICTLVNIKDPSFSSAVESSISFNDLTAFVFEDKDDMNKFKMMMDQKRFRVNMVHSMPTDLSSYHPPVALEILRRFGFECYMSDLVDAPDAVLTYLYRNNGINRIPVSRTDQISHENLPDKIFQFFMGSLRVSRSRSRYDNETITETSKIKEARLLKIAVDKDLIYRHEKEIQKCETRNNEIDQVTEELKELLKNLQRDLETWRNEKQGYISREAERSQLKKRIEAKREQIRRFENDTFDERKEEKLMEKKVINNLKTSLSYMKEGVRLLNHEMNQDCCSTINEMKLWEVSKKLIKESVDDSEKEIQELEREKSALDREKNEMKESARSTLNQLCRSLNLRSSSDIPEDQIQSFRDSKEEDIEAKLGDLEARLDCLHTADEEEIREYNKREESISKIQEQLEAISQRNATKLNEITEIRDSWLPCINELISNINTCFTSFMERLGCAGEVQLIHDANENDFSKYGIAIMVKFRGGNKLRMLTAQHQSGGERAVSTALYMLALQNQKSVPFRCVDEINQGMDPVNERMMLLMLMETAAKEESSQYFFVSPKLLPDLEYSDRVNVVIVQNGDFRIPSGRNVVRDHIKISKKASSRASKHK